MKIILYLTLGLVLLSGGAWLWKATTSTSRQQTQRTPLWRTIYPREPVWLKVPTELGDEAPQQSKAPDKVDNGKDEKIKEKDYELHSVLPTWYSAHFMDSSRGWVAGSAITRANFFSVPGGGLIAITLTAFSTPVFSSRLLTRAVLYRDREGAAEHSSQKRFNSGQSWSIQRVLEYDHIMSVFFIDTLNGWVAGSDKYNDRAIGVVAKTSDGGKSWLPML